MANVRIYKRVSTTDQCLDRQNSLINDAKAKGYYIAGIYEEKASGVNPDRPELNRLINDLQEGDIVLAENIDRITRLPINEAMLLIERITEKKAKISVPGYIDLKEFETGSTIADILLESLTELLLKMLLVNANANYVEIKERQRKGIELAKERGAYKGRKADTEKHKLIIKLRAQGESISATAKLANCSESLVKKVTRQERDRKKLIDQQSKQVDFIEE